MQPLRFEVRGRTDGRAGKRTSALARAGAHRPLINNGNRHRRACCTGRRAATDAASASCSPGYSRVNYVCGILAPDCSIIYIIPLCAIVVSTFVRARARARTDVAASAPTSVPSSSFTVYRTSSHIGARTRTGARTRAHTYAHTRIATLGGQIGEEEFGGKLVVGRVDI